MQEFSKVTRWVGPGSVFLLVLFVQFMALRVAAGVPLSTSLELLSGELVALVVAMSIPLGFIIYQAYHHALDNQIFFLGERFGVCHRDFGRETFEQVSCFQSCASTLDATRRTSSLLKKEVAAIVARLPIKMDFAPLVLRDNDKEVFAQEKSDSDRDEKNLSQGAKSESDNDEEILAQEKRSNSPPHGRERRRELLQKYYTEREDHWVRQELHLIAAYRDMQNDSKAVREVDRLADIYHTLGACRDALVWATIGTISLFAMSGTGTLEEWRNIFWAALMFVFTCFITFIVWLVIHRNRSKTLSRRTRVVAHLIEEAQECKRNNTPCVKKSFCKHKP